MEKIGQYFGISRMAVSKRHNRVIKKLKELMATWVPFSVQKIFLKKFQEFGLQSEFKCPYIWRD